MTKYCVSCKAQTTRARCAGCFHRFMEGGCNKRIERVDEFHGCRVQVIEFESAAPAKYCNDCAKPIDEKRSRFALMHGGECYRCYWCSRGRT